MRLIFVIIVLLAHHAAAEAKCKRSGTVLFREAEERVEGAWSSYDANPRTLTIYATGGWVQVFHTTSGDKRTTGCLRKGHLKALKQALARARFELGAAACTAQSTLSATYSAPKRKKKITTATPCGRRVDEGTKRTS